MDAITLVLSAAGPGDLFDSALGEDELKKRYRKLARQVHPDRFGDSHKKRASDAFDKLQKLWGELNGKPAQTTSSAFTLTTKKHTYVFGDKLFSDSISTYFAAQYRDGDDARSVWVRFGKTPGDNAHLDAHAKALKKLREVPDDFKIFHPQLVDHARHRESGSNVERRVVVTEAGPLWIALDELKRMRDDWYPADARDMAWIFRRLLVIVGTAHDIGISNGGIRMDNINVLPESHMVTVLDWSFSQELTEEDRVRDIKNVVACMESLLEKQEMVPRQISTFFSGCKVSKLPSASVLLGEFDELIERLYGPRTFRVFAMPDATTTKGH